MLQRHFALNEIGRRTSGGAAPRQEAPPPRVPILIFLGCFAFRRSPAREERLAELQAFLDRADATFDGMMVWLAEDERLTRGLQ